MDLANLKSYQRTIASVDLPLKHFIETGFWNPYVIEGWTENDIGDTFVRRAARHIAKELKRPFIQCHAVIQFRESYDTGKKTDDGRAIWDVRDLDTPRFRHGYVQMPKQKRLAPLVAPLFLLPERTYPQTSQTSGEQQHTKTLWRFKVFNRELWDQYYAFALNDPDCRKARRLTA